jgi:TRAP-type C4-dicarboxylate transport system substrate-binding protein
MYEEIPELTDELAAYNIKLLYIQGSLCPDIHTTEPFETLEDLEGMKIALGGPGESAIFEAIGAVPVVVPGPDRYVSLQRNVVQGQMLGINDIADNALYEVAKHYTYVSWTRAGAVLHLWIGLDFWNSLTTAQQDIFTQAAEEGDQWYNGTFITEAEQKSLKTLKDAGVNFYTLSDEDNKAWLDAVPNTAATWANQMEEQGQPGWKVLEAYLKICEEEGYVWLRDWTQE